MPRPVALPDLDHLIQRYESGVSLKQLAQECGVSRPTLASRLREAGVQMRDASAAQAAVWAAGGPEMVMRNLGPAWRARSAKGGTPEEANRRALTAEDSLRLRGRYEDTLATALRARGVAVVQQMACGPYNLDLSVPEPYRVAVEVLGSNVRHATGLHRIKAQKRLEYLLGGGWCVILLDCQRWPGRAPFDFDRVADQLVAYLDLPGWPESFAGRYGVTGGDGEPVAARSLYFDNLPLVPRPVAACECACHRDVPR